MCLTLKVLPGPAVGWGSQTARGCAAGSWHGLLSCSLCCCQVCRGGGVHARQLESLWWGLWFPASCQSSTRLPGLGCSLGAPHSQGKAASCLPQAPRSCTLVESLSHCLLR